MFINAAVTRFPVDLNSTYQYVIGDSAHCAFQAVSSIPITQLEPRDVVYMRPAAIINQLAMAGRDMCMKTHHANLTIDDIPLCPAKISKGALYVVRDPRDVVISLSKHVGMDIDEAIDLMASENACLTRDGFHVFSLISSWSDNVRSWLDEQNAIPTQCVRYEDMLHDREATFVKILEALGLRLEPEAIEFGLEQTVFERLKQKEDETGFRETGNKQERFFNTGMAGKWRGILTDDQVARIERDHGDMMQELGYELSLTNVGV